MIIKTCFLCVKSFFWMPTILRDSPEEKSPPWSIMTQGVTLFVVYCITWHQDMHLVAAVVPSTPPHVYSTQRFTEARVDGAEGAIVAGRP